MRTYGWDAVKLSEAYTLEELAQLRDLITNDPASANPGHATGADIYLYNKKARRKLDAIGWAVYYKQQEARRADER